MINNKLYIDLSKHVDVTEFDRLHPEICRGIATASKFAFDGLQSIHDGTINPNVHGHNVKPLYDAYSQYKSLPETDPIKIFGKDLDYNQMTAYLKFALGAYDLYSIYKIYDVESEASDSETIGDHFPNLLKWIFSLKDNGTFDSIYSATIMVIEAGGIPWEHRDPEHAVIGNIAEFIHIKTDLERSFYMIDPLTNNRVYLNHTRVAWWDENDWHGGEPINRPTYTLRINGKFTSAFKQKIEIGD